MYAITNGAIVGENEVLTGMDLIVDGDTIADIVPSGGLPASRGVVVDARGAFLMPGFVDIHADYIERMAAPRPTSLMDFSLSLREAERELATHGITTMFHSLSFFDHVVFDSNPIRDPENTKRFIDIIDSSHESKHLIRHRFHARFEIDNLRRVEEIRGYIRDGKVHLISFMDHTPGQGQYRDLGMYRGTIKGYRGLSDDEIDREILHLQGKVKLEESVIRAIADLALSNGIAVASHDDDSLEKLAFVHGLGATISEFPITLEAAREARRLGMRTVVGAPNVLLGGSHSGNLSAVEAVRGGCVDILCSDYYPAALLHSVFSLAEKQGLGLPAATRLATLHPAMAVNMGDRLGSLVPGKKADLILVEKIGDGFPVVVMVVVAGSIIMTTNYRAS
ncbi:MAG: phosphonate metabolism protein PhnM [Rectinemataceae bacterium]|jgi:alpha-D-ribose 1-methylphosphonate 5-triphosphate diphosphatase